MDLFQHGQAVALIKKGSEMMQSENRNVAIRGEKMLEEGRRMLKAAGIPEADIDATEARRTTPDESSAETLLRLLETPPEDRPMTEDLKEVYGKDAVEKALELLGFRPQKRKEG